MPLYDYRCEKGHRYEKREPFGSPATQPCEKCGKTARRVLHAPAIAFKGSGWYKNDARGSRPSAAEEKKSSRSKASATSEKSKKSDGKSGGATDSKQSGKTEKAAAD